MKYFKYTVISIISIVLSLFLITLSNGYIRYRTIIYEKPLSKIVNEIRNNKNYTPLNEINQNFINAIIAVEDPKFYQHKGILFSNILEALITNLKEHDLVMGGSTITQQLSKNLYLDQKKTYERKIAELFFVKDMEKELTKNEILEMYLNIIYFGDGYYGIKEAAQGYFHVEPKDLTMEQATLLAGLPQAPAIYQLSDGMQFARQRQLIVLEAMEDAKYISKEEKNIIYNRNNFFKK